MARKPKEEDLYIQRASQRTIDAAIKDGTKKVYYYTEGEEYVVWDLRGKKYIVKRYGSAEEVIKNVK